MAKIPMVMRDCTERDYETDFGRFSSTASLTLAASQYLRCFEDISSLSFTGSWKTASGEVLIVEVRKCSEPNCVSEQELSEYLEDYNLGILANTQQYHSEVYTDEAISYSVRHWEQTLDNHKAKFQNNIQIQKNHLSSIENFSGFAEEDRSYFQLPEEMRPSPILGGI